MRQRDLSDHLADQYWADNGVRTPTNGHLIEEKRVRDQLAAYGREHRENSRAAAAPAQPLFPGIDRFFERIPAKFKRFVLFMCFVIPFSFFLRHGNGILESVGAGLGGVLILAVAYRLLILSVKAVAIAAYVAFLACAALAAIWFLIKW